MTFTCPNLRQNENLVDRIIRVVIGSVALVLGYFWLTGSMQSIAYLVSLITLATGLTGFCGLYKLFKFKTLSQSAKTNSKLNSKALASLLGLSLILVGVGSVISITITKKKFLEDFNHMNGFYKQTLFLTGQSKRAEAKQQYDLLAIAYSDFNQKYSGYQPYSLRKDSELNSDLQTVQSIIANAKTGVETGDLVQTHKELEAVRPIFQEMFKRNGFSMLAIALVDFHDIMEEIIAAADAKNSQQLLAVYPKVDSALKLVEKEDNSSEVQIIRQNLESLKALAEAENSAALATKAAELKASFVKVYLIKG